MLARVVALLACASSLAVVPAASAADPALVVRGSRSGYVDVKFSEPFVVDPYSFEESHRKGRLGGFFAERRGVAYADTSDHFGVIRIGRDDTTVTARIAKGPIWTPETTYGAGTYRIHVLADAPFQITLPVPKGLSRTVVVTPTRYVATPRLVGPVAGKRSSTGVTWTSTERISVGPARTTVLSAAVVTWQPVGGHVDRLCVTEPGTDCPPGASWDNWQVGTGSQRGSGFVLAGPGALEPGPYDAVQHEETLPPENFRTMHGWALVFDTPA